MIDSIMSDAEYGFSSFYAGAIIYISNELHLSISHHSLLISSHRCAVV